MLPLALPLLGSDVAYALARRCSPASCVTALRRFAAYRYAALDLSPAPCVVCLGVTSYLATRWAPPSLTPRLLGVPPPLVRLLSDALPHIVLPLLVALLLCAPFFWAGVLPFALLLVGLCGRLCLGLWAPLRPLCGCSWTLHRLLLCRSQSPSYSVRCFVRWLCCLLLLWSWGSIVAYAWARWCSSALCATAHGRFVALYSTVLDRSLAPLLCAPCFEVAMLPSAPPLVGCHCSLCLGPWGLLRPLCYCSCALRCHLPLCSQSPFCSMRCLSMLLRRLRL